MSQWQCPCGVWVDMDHSRHIHQVEGRLPTLAEITAARLAGRENEALTPVSEITEVKWSPSFPRRKTPDAET